MAVQEHVLRVRRPAVDVRAATLAALSNGATLHSPSYATWDIQGRCLRPVIVEQVGEHHFEMSKRTGKRQLQTGRALAMKVPCRQCSQCLRTRQRLWGNRAVQETVDSSRTWFGTLTFAPSERYRLELLTRHRLEAQGITLEELPPVERFRELAKEANHEVQKFIKRLRFGNKREKRPPAVMRFFLAVEPHEDWRPHFHMLVHEVSEVFPVTKAMLEGPWQLGFVKWRLLKNGTEQDAESLKKVKKAAFYAAKYLGKFSIARVRASEDYGDKVAERLRPETHELSSVKHIDPPNKSPSSALAVMLCEQEMQAAREAAIEEDAVMGPDP